MLQVMECLSWYDRFVRVCSVPLRQHHKDAVLPTLSLHWNWLFSNMVQPLFDKHRWTWKWDQYWKLIGLGLHCIYIIWFTVWYIYINKIGLIDPRAYWGKHKERISKCSQCTSLPHVDRHCYSVILHSHWKADIPITNKTFTTAVLLTSSSPHIVSYLWLGMGISNHFIVNYPDHFNDTIMAQSHYFHYTSTNP